MVAPMVVIRRRIFVVAISVPFLPGVALCDAYEGMTWTPDWLSVSGRLVVECPPGVGHLGGCPVGEP